MVKRAVCLVLCVLIALTAGGCWDYRSLGDFSLVLGMAIDMDENTGEYILTFEVFHVGNSASAQEQQSQMIDGRGKTIFDAVRNTKRRLMDKLYFGSASVLIVSQQIMRSGELLPLLGWFMSDAETRETLCLIVAQTHMAREIFKTEEQEHDIVSNVIHNIVTEDSAVTSSAAHAELYEAFNMLYAPGISLTLPAIHLAINQDIMVPELNGTAVFRNQRLVGYLTAEESKFFLIARGKARGGILTMPDPEGEGNLALEISSSSGGISVTFEGEEPTLHVKTETKVFVGEKRQTPTRPSGNRVKQIETAAGELVRANIEEVIKRAQEEFRSDIFGFGNDVYKHNLNMWNKVGDRWVDLFQTANVQVDAKVYILNTAFMQ